MNVMSINIFINCTHDVHKALIVGAGYISLEVLENLYQRGLDITLILSSTSSEI
jgi:CoA-disulfide reductase